MVRNHVYDFFQLFDYPDPKIVQGDRKTLSTNQQALFLMNSQMIQDKAMKIAKHEFDQNLPRQVSKFYQKVFLRNPGPEERREGERFLDEFLSQRPLSCESFLRSGYVKFRRVSLFEMNDIFWNRRAFLQTGVMGLGHAALVNGL